MEIWRKKRKGNGLSGKMTAMAQRGIFTDLGKCLKDLQKGCRGMAATRQSGADGPPDLTAPATVSGLFLIPGELGADEGGDGFDKDDGAEEAEEEVEGGVHFSVLARMWTSWPVR